MVTMVTMVTMMRNRRAPFRHSRDARVYGHTTTVMHKLSTPPPAAPFVLLRLDRDAWSMVG